MAGLGLLSTLLPMWSLKVHPTAYGRTAEGSDGPTAKGDITVHIGFYDWIVSGRPVGAVLPVVLALAAAAAVAALLAGPDRQLWAIVAAAAVCAVIVVVGTAISPDSKGEVTGPVAERMSRSDVATIEHPAPVDVAIGAGAVLAILATAVVGALAAWQYFAARERP